MSGDSGKKVRYVVPKMAVNPKLTVKSPTTRRARVFLDSAPKDYTLAKYVEQKLREKGLEVEEFSRARKLLQDPLRKAVSLIGASDAAVFLATPNSVRDEWVLAELGAAIATEHPLVVLMAGVGSADLPSPFQRGDVVGFNHLDDVISGLSRRLADEGAAAQRRRKRLAAEIVA